MGKSKAKGNKVKNSTVKEGNAGTSDVKKSGRAKTSESKVAKVSDEEKVIKQQITENRSMNTEEQLEQLKKKARISLTSVRIVKTKEDTVILKGKEPSEMSRKEQKTKATTSSSAKRFTKNDQVVAEAKAAFGSLSTSEGRSLRKRPAAVSLPKPLPKKARTLQKTANV